MSLTRGPEFGTITGHQEIGGHLGKQRLSEEATLHEWEWTRLGTTAVLRNLGIQTGGTWERYAQVEEPRCPGETHEGTRGSCDRARKSLMPRTEWVLFLYVRSDLLRSHRMDRKPCFHPEKNS